MKKSVEVRIRSGVVKKATRTLTGISQGKTKAALPKVTGKVLRILTHGKNVAVSSVVNRTGGLKHA